jgi:tRNA (cytidine/uridine-2'-O-)-methyltransferase
MQGISDPYDKTAAFVDGFCGTGGRFAVPEIYDFFAKNDVKKMFCLSTKAPRCYTEADLTGDCYLFLGKETKGLPEDFLEANRESCVRIPMRSEARSLNLSNSVAIAVYEALRQQNFPDLQDYGKMRV